MVFLDYSLTGSRKSQKPCNTGSPVVLNLWISMFKKMSEKFRCPYELGLLTIDISAMFLRAPRGPGIPQPGPQSCPETDSHFSC